MAKNQLPLYKDPKQPIEKRVDDLISRMTLEEKATQMPNAAKAIERLDVPQYDYWNECLHGIGRGGVATVFPQAIGMAATWSTDTISKMADIISDEARAKYHNAIKNGIRKRYLGLTFWSPNINILRDPRWGRAQETYGEDPYLTARLAVEFVKGLQGDDPKYLKLVATPKHFAAHSGPEANRHSFDAKVSQRDLRETYLPAFEACIKEAKAESIMSAYNRLNGEPCSGSKTLLLDILRDEWGFKGYIVADCGALDDIPKGHKVTKTLPETAALAVNASCDLDCSDTMYGNRLVFLESIVDAVKQGLLSEKKVDAALRRLFTARFKLGMFDPDEMVPYAKTPYEVNDCQKHRDYAAEVSRQSIVLLKNQNNALPLNKNLKTIAVIGPNADNLETLLGNYYGDPSKYVTPLQGIKNKAAKANILYAKGCDITKPDPSEQEAVDIAKKADVVIMVLGLTSKYEGEEGDAAGSDGGGDRIKIGLPVVQQQLLEKIYAIGKPVVLVIANGSSLAVNWADENVPAIVEIWYPGEEGGTALANVLFGDYNPAGRLPVTFYKSAEQLPPFGDYSMKNRTYRFMTDIPLYPFGYGLSYTTFEYSHLVIKPKKAKTGDKINVSVDVTNTGKLAGDEVVQLYISHLEASVPAPLRQLQGFKRINIKAGQTKTVRFTLEPKQLAVFTDDGKRIVEPGKIRIVAAGFCPLSEKFKTGKNMVEGTLELTGKTAKVS